MKIKYFLDTDTLHIELREAAVADTTDRPGRRHPARPRRTGERLRHHH